MSKQVLAIGIDAGGTQTRLLARTNSALPDLNLHGEPANALRSGAEQSAKAISDLVRQALVQRPSCVLQAIHAGIAGAGSLEMQRSIAGHLRQRLSLDQECTVTVSHDGITSIEGAFAGESGLLFIAGTGSGVLIRTHEGVDHHGGGWGYLIGDEGSGYALGRSGLAAVANEIDGGPVTMLRNLLQERFGIAGRNALLRAVFDKTWPIQQVAPLVVQAAEALDPIAAKIVSSETRALARQAGWLLQRIKSVRPRFAVCGGLGESEYYVTCLRHAMQTVWPEANLCRPRFTGLEGALRLAQKEVPNGFGDRL